MRARFRRWRERTWTEHPKVRRLGFTFRLATRSRTHIRKSCFVFRPSKTSLRVGNHRCDPVKEAANMSEKMVVAGLLVAGMCVAAGASGQGKKIDAEGHEWW